MPELSAPDASPPPDSDAPTKAAHKKRTPIASQATPTRAEDKKKFNWNLYPDAHSYLKERFQEMLVQDEKEWLKIKKDAVETMLLKFDFSGYNDGEMREIGRTWFKNELQRSRAKSRNIVAQALTAPSQELEVAPQPHVHHAVESLTSLDELIGPLLKHVKTRASSAQNLWAAEHEDTVRERKVALGGGIGAHSTAVDQLFEALPAEERELWEKRVIVEKLKLLEDISACFENQKNFPRVLAMLIDRFIGFRPDQIGAAIVFFRIAMRNKEGGIDWDQYTVGVKEGTESFTVFDGGPQQHEINRWEAYGHAHLDQNPLLRDPRFKYAEDGCPKLPPYSENWTMKDLAAALDSWLHAMWGYCREKAELELPNGLDWDVIKADPKKFIPTEWLDAEIRRPADVPFHILAALYYRFLDSQEKAHAFRWVHLQKAPVQAPTGAASSESFNAVPATPSKQRRVVFSTPVSTPSRTRTEPSKSPSKSHLHLQNSFVPESVQDMPISTASHTRDELPDSPSKSRIQVLSVLEPVQAQDPSLPSTMSPVSTSPEMLARQLGSGNHTQPSPEPASGTNPEPAAHQDGAGSNAACESAPASAASELGDAHTAGLIPPESEAVRSTEVADDIADNVSTMSTLTEDSDAPGGRAADSDLVPPRTASKRKEGPAVGGQSVASERAYKRTKRTSASADLAGVTLRRSSRHNTETTADGPSHSDSVLPAPKPTRNKGRQSKITAAKELQPATRALRSKTQAAPKGATKGVARK